MSTTNPEPHITNEETPSGVPPTPIVDTPITVLTPSSNGGLTTEEFKTSNNTQSVPADLSVVQANTATNFARPSPSVRQFFPGGGDGDGMKREKLDLDALEQDARSTGTYAGALIMTATVVPVVAAFISAAAFVVQWPKGVALPDWLTLLLGTPLLLGTVPTLIVWLFLAFLVRRFTAVDRMNMGSYGLLLNRLSSLDAQLSILYPEPAETPAGAPGPNAHAVSTPPPSAAALAMAGKEVLDCRNSISKTVM